MITKLIRWLFSPRKAPIMRGSATVDAWEQLLELGYSIESYSVGGLRCYSFWRNGEQVTDWSAPTTLDELYRMRRIWSVDELARVQESEE